MLRPLAGRLARFGLRVLREQCYRRAGGEQRPVFFDVEATLPELRRIDDDYDAIREELMALLPERASMPRYHEVDERQDGISNADERDWRVFFVYLFGQEDRLPNSRLCPRTVAAVRGIPGVLNAFFSILEAGKSVPAHEGPSYHYLRYHTAFRVPSTKPPTLRVKDRYHTWAEGESLLFDDSWEHEVTNESDSERVVLIVDVVRPGPWWLRLLHRGVRRLNQLSTDEETRRLLFARVGLQQP